MEVSNPQLDMEEEGERRLASDKPWPVDIDVYLYDANDPDGFEVVSILPIDNSDPKDPLLVFENKDRPGFKLLFHLHDQTGEGYRFADDADDAVWSIKAEKGCPTKIAHEVFKPLRVKDGTLLVVENENSDKDGGPIGKFRYTLNVSKDGKPPYLPLDPGGNDQNGPRTVKFR